MKNHKVPEIFDISLEKWKITVFLLQINVFFTQYWLKTTLKSDTFLKKSL
jgi:hypothetical protein